MTEHSGIILTTASFFKLDPDLVNAQVLVESGAKAWSYNPEPKYRYFWDVKRRRPFRQVTQLELASKFPPADFPTLVGDSDQEWWAQQASWGLLQVMGAVARERGFKGDYLCELLDPSINLTMGCGLLAELLKWANGNTTQALCAYNGGKGGNDKAPYRNQAYATKVLAQRANIIAS